MYDIKDYLINKGVKENIGKGFIYIDNGTDEIIIKEKDLCDFIVIYDDSIKVYNNKGEFILSTIGYFLDKVQDMTYRAKIIDRLISLQQDEIMPHKVEYWGLV